MKNIIRLENVSDFYELKNLCNELNLNTCNDIVDDDDVGFLVREALGEGNDWQQVARLLANVNNLHADGYGLSAYGYIEDLEPGELSEYINEAVAEYEEQQ